MMRLLLLSSRRLRRLKARDAPEICYDEDEGEGVTDYIVVGENSLSVFFAMCE